MDRSWHLWFDHGDVLDVIPCTNFQGYIYKFTKQTLGFAYRRWDRSTYDKQRVARVIVEQTIGNNGKKKSAYIVISQEPGSVKEISATYYQFGRKDAFPGIDKIADGSFNQNDGNNISVTNSIQHPEIFYIGGDYTKWRIGFCQLNLWSMDTTDWGWGFNDNPVVKTIYDPCPAGFHIPASNAFTGFATNGKNGAVNASGAWDYGWHFNNKLSSPDATVYFPALGFRTPRGIKRGLDGVSYAYYWSAIPSEEIPWTAEEDYFPYGCTLQFSSRGGSVPQATRHRSFGVPVRPVSE